MRTMTSYEVTIIGSGADAIEVYDGEDEGKFTDAIRRTKSVLKSVDYRLTNTTRYEKDGTVWFDEVIFFIADH